MKKKKQDPDYQIVMEWVDRLTPPIAYSDMQYEQAFWHLWTLNCYHVTMSFDLNMILLLDWALDYHMGLE